MENWVNFFILSSESEGIAINTDILETNLVNIILLLVLLVNVLGKFLKENLTTRQAQIINNIEDGEKRLNEANERLAEAKSQWAQAQIIIEEIKNQIQKNKASLLESEFNQANQDLSQRFNNMLMVLRYREQQVFNDVMKQVSELTLDQVTSKLPIQLSETEQSLIIDKKINQLGGRI
jgi:F-type H+-transporting ATPase subunit b